MLKNILNLGGANLIAQVIAFACIPVITRIYNPVTLGEYQFFTTVALLIAPIISGSFAMKIISSKSKEEALLSLKVGFIYSSIIFLIFIFLFPIILWGLSGTKFEWFRPYLIFLLIFSYLSSNFQFIYAYLNNCKEYKVLSFITLEKSVLSNFFKIFFSFFWVHVVSLIAAIILTELMQIIRLINNKKKIHMEKISKKEFIGYVYLNKQYPTYFTGYLLVSVTMNWFPIILASFFYGSKYTGLLGLAFMVVNTPVYPFINVIQNLCFGELSRAKYVNEYINFYRKIIIFTIPFSIVGVLFLYLLGEWIFSIIFGANWTLSGRYAFICFIPIALSMVFSPTYNHINTQFKLQKKFFIVNLILFLMSFSISCFAGFKSLKFDYFIMVSAVFMSILHIVLFIISILTCYSKRKCEV